jgi:hypothetical protein
MSHPGDIVRRRVALWMGGGALAALLVGGLAFLPDGKTPVRAETGQPVTPGFAAHAADIRLIMVTTSEESYHLASENGRWVLPEKGRYPARPELVAQLIDAMANLRYGAPRTTDARKLDRLGLGDPAERGSGALVEIGNGNGEMFARLIVGRKDGRTYIRRPGDAQAWLAEAGDPPPLHRAARWLDLQVVSIAPADIAGVDVRPAGSPAYRLVPVDDAGGRFVLGPPHNARRLVANFAPNPPALALTRLAPDDVAGANAVAAAQPLGEHITHLRNGVDISLSVFRASSGGFARISASAAPGAPPEAAAAATAINQRAAPWAFGLSETDWSALTTPLSAIAD